MGSLRNEVIERSEAGEFRQRFREYCRNWKKFRTPLALAHIVRHAAEDGRGDDLYEVLFDEEFRVERQALFGVNELRSDLHAGRDYFSSRSPDLLRYMQITFLEQAASDDPEIVIAHRRNCKGFEEFLQLDRLPEERLNKGLHKILSRFFPVTYDPGKDPDAWGIGIADADPVTVRLISYEAGEWSCACGRSAGFDRRYDFTCPCGALYGHGRLSPVPAKCSHCQHTADYVQCDSCGTRVTLGILWQMRRAGTHPSVYRISVIVNLAVEKAQGAAEVKRLTLLYLPVPLGLQERADRIIFDLPDMLWLDELSDRDFVGNLIRLSDLPRYDRQTDLCRVLEAALRRALWGGRSDNKNPGYRGFGNYLAKELLRWQRQPYPQDLAERAEWHLANRYTRRFENRIGYNLRLPGSGPDELVRFSDISAECTVEASPKLQHNMVMMNRRLADPGMLSAPFLVHFDERLDEDERITRDLPEAAEERTANLDEWGIVPPGQSVAPGQVLVGIVSPTADEEITPEERLLRAIFGEKVNPVRDRSLLMTGQRPGRVLTQRLDLLVGQGDGIPSIPGRLVERVGDSRVRITVVVDQPLEAGDVLVGESGATGVICGVTSGAALQRAAGTANVPDLVVAPGHPWAPQPGRAGSHAVRIRLKHDELLGRMVTSRAAGQYALVSQMPVWVNSQDFAQSLEAGDFRWLITHQAYELAMELYGPRCDCVDWRLQFHETLLRADRAPKATGDQTRGVVVAT